MKLLIVFSSVSIDNTTVKEDLKIILFSLKKYIYNFVQPNYKLTRRVNYSSYFEDKILPETIILIRYRKIYNKYFENIFDTHVLYS